MARTSYAVWERGIGALGDALRGVRVDVEADLRNGLERGAVRKRVVKIAGMVAGATGGRARVEVWGGNLGGVEQAFLEEGVRGVVPREVGVGRKVVESKGLVTAVPREVGVGPKVVALEVVEVEVKEALELRGP